MRSLRKRKTTTTIRIASTVSFSSLCKLEFLGYSVRFGYLKRFLSRRTRHLPPEMGTPNDLDPTMVMETGQCENDQGLADSDLEEKYDWLTAMSRRTKKKLAQLHKIVATATTTGPKPRSDTIPKHQRPPPLPKEDYKVVVRPREALNLAKWPVTQVSISIFEAGGFSIGHPSTRNLKSRVDTIQNIVTVSTPELEVAKKIRSLTAINLGGREYTVAAYVTAPDDSAKGVIHGVPAGTTPEVLVDNIYAPGYEIIYARMLGHSQTAVITFEGKRVPFYVYFYGAEMRCALYRATRLICNICQQLGHRADVCPNPETNKCPTCGMNDPEKDHPCTPKCALCQGAHPTISKECPERLKRPFVPKATSSIPSQRRSRRDQSGTGTGHRDGYKPIFRTRSHSRAGSRQGRSKDRGGPGTQQQPAAGTSKVSWAARLSTQPTAQLHFPPLPQKLPVQNQLEQVLTELCKVNARCEQLNARCGRLEEENKQLRHRLTRTHPTPPSSFPVDRTPLPQPTTEQPPTQTKELEHTPMINEETHPTKANEEQTKLEMHMFMNMMQQQTQSIQQSVQQTLLHFQEAIREEFQAKLSEIRDTVTNEKQSRKKAKLTEHTTLDLNSTHLNQTPHDG